MFARFRDENATISAGRSFTPGFLLSDHAHGLQTSRLPPDELNSSALDRVEILILADRRQLAWSEYGHRHGYPLIYLHREAGSRVEAKLLHESACAAGFRLISVDRPGIGFSSFKSLKNTKDLVCDYQQLIQHLNLKHAGLISWGASSGLALELAKHIKDKISIVSLIAPLRPQAKLPKVMGLQWLMILGMRLVLSARSSRMKADETGYFLRWREQLGYADKKQVDNPWVSSLFIDMARQSLRQGSAGAAQDLVLSFFQEVAPQEGISIPVNDWSGSSDCSADLIAQEEGSLYFRHFIRRQGKLFINRSASEIFKVARQSLALSPVVCDPQRR